MVAVIKTGYSLRRSFHYNENKVNDGVATCIMAANYPMDLEFMQESHRIAMLQKTAEKNPTIKRNSVHISLNFSPDEKLSDEKLKLIAADYMEGIGFGNQPYLVYQHFDAGHPHIHIVSTRVQSEGPGIVTQNIARLKSEPARKAIEEKYGLVKAQDHKRELFRIKPVNVERVVYGKIDSKRAMSNVLDHVLDKYRYTSLPQLNAVLNLYNIHADRGSENSRIRKNNGLIFRIIGNDGQYLGVPVKASEFYSRPTLNNLGKRFLKNAAKKDDAKSSIRNSIDMVYLRSPQMKITELGDALKNAGIDVVLRYGKNEVIYGVTFVDHRSKQIFNGRELGVAYAANTLQQRPSKPHPSKSATEISMQKNRTISEKSGKLFPPDLSRHISPNPGEMDEQFDKSLVNVYFQNEYSSDYLPSQLKGKRKRPLKRRAKKSSRI